MVRKTTRTTKTTKPATTRAAKAGTAAGAAPVADPTPAGASPEAAVAAPRLLGKRELIDLVVAASGIKKKAAKPVIEAMLKELGDALSRGETLNLQPFGKANVKRHKDLENAEIIELRLRRSKLALKAAEAHGLGTPGTPKDPLAEAAE